MRRSRLTRWETEVGERSAQAVRAAAADDPRAGLLWVAASDRRPQVVWAYQLGRPDGAVPAPLAVPAAAVQTYEFDLLGDSVGLPPGCGALVPGPNSLRVQIERLEALPGARDDVVRGLAPMAAAVEGDPSIAMYLVHTTPTAPDEAWVIVPFDAGFPSTDETAAARLEVADRIVPLLAGSDVWRVDILKGGR